MTAVSAVTGLARSTIDGGGAEIKAGADCGKGRVRRTGGGRRKLGERDAGLIDDLKALVEPATRGDPDRPLCCGPRRAYVISRRRSAKGATG